MLSFINDNFLLRGAVAERLFHATARHLPVVDYHNHLDPAALAGDRTFEDLTALWIAGDPYKHRAMRINGITEERITGQASAYDKFLAWAETFPRTWGNPLYHWNCLELQRVFGEEELLSPATAEDIWRRANAQLGEPRLSAQGILRGFGVETLCTSDDLLQDLGFHGRATARGTLTVLPSLRGDSITDVTRSGFPAWLAQLAALTGREIRTLEDYLVAVDLRLEEFARAGGVLADHALNSGYRFLPCTHERAAELFAGAAAGAKLGEEAGLAIKNYLILELASRYASRDWGLQLHVGAQRKTSARLRSLAGDAGGYASIGSAADVASIATLLDTIERGQHGLPDIILYTLNPSDNAGFASLTGSFAESGRPGKIQFGPSWWYNDHLDGIRDQLQAVAAHGLLHHFIGMTTDSRSLLSFSRHEYFRRILCNLLGEWVDAGRIPNDEALLTEAVTNIGYRNAADWLGRKVAAASPTLSSN
ncbi:glucuronate isomerase [Neolewinella lacunae]|uniref:Uronate isomerase n=1 Tax=Neolewinella lacunae TaxID=1517758 RepID=A0A923TDR8_9BACT|nr:glucuronate isomerase [Neolewinella lacunae]MBC6995142.1 glucuronate isomerase [Neolewinella lacunae]MDN3634092.1 glucuronate isomerase [Neolewinella lacunae]